jgi:hypothetical protein
MFGPLLGPEKAGGAARPGASPGGSALRRATSLATCRASAGRGARARTRMRGARRWREHAVRTEALRCPAMQGSSYRIPSFLLRRAAALRWGSRGISAKRIKRDAAQPWEHRGPRPLVEVFAPQRADLTHLSPTQPRWGSPDDCVGSSSRSSSLSLQGRLLFRGGDTDPKPLSAALLRPPSPGRHLSLAWSLSNPWVIEARTTAPASESQM